MNHRRPFVLSTLLFACSLLVLCALPSAAHGQSATATLSGTVVDQNGAVVPSAEITVENISTALKRQATTNDQGDFTIVLLPPATYTLTAQRTGFAPLRIDNVVLNVGDQKALQIQLKAGDVSEMVKITTDAPLINESPAVGTVVDRQFVGNLPLNGRTFQSLISLTPGVVLTKATVAEQGQFSVNGQRPNSNYFTVDGVSANIGSSPGNVAGQSTAGSLPGFGATGGTNNLVSVDALQEFKVQTSTYAPEYGRSPGAQVSIVTRSGTNQFHGALFEYFRNDVLDANDWFANANRQPKPALRQNDFGGVFSGPLFLPRFGEGGPALYNGKNQTFFFISYEGLRLRLPSTGITTVPSLNARQTALPSIQPFLNAFPRPNGRDLANNLSEFVASYSDPSVLDATSVRIDHALSNKLALFGRYNYAPSKAVNRGNSRSSALSNLLDTQINTQTFTVGATASISPAVSNDLRINYSKNRGLLAFSIDSFGGAIPINESAIYTLPVSSQDAFFIFNLRVPTVAWQNGAFGGDTQRQFNLVDTFSGIAGAHSVKVGVDYRRLFPIFNRASYQQSALFVGGVNQAITGRSTRVSVIGFTNPRLPVFTNLSLFVQDTWKATARLTLTYGLRWEFNPPPHDANGNDPIVLLGLDNPTNIAVAPAGTALYKKSYRDFAPRVGFGYQASKTPGKETVIRAGFGVFYDLGTSAAASAFGFGAPFRRSKNVANAFLPLDPVSAVAPALNLTPPFSQLIGLVDPNFRLPYTLQWNVSVEQSLGHSQSISASYIGAAGHRLPRQEVFTSQNRSVVTVNYFLTRSVATSDYRALQLQFNRRLSGGFQALGSYTWSRSTDNVSSDLSNEAPVQNIDLSHERGPSDFDVRHAFSAALTYDIRSPFAKGFANAVTRNFSIDAILTARSATPVNIITGTDSGGGFNVSRPDLVPGVPLHIDDVTVGGGKRINPAAFTVPVGRQGTLGRNALRGFSVWQLDLALRRQFSLTERVKLQLRSEFFNIFNHPNFADPQNNLSDPLFGRSIVMLGRSLGSGGSNGGLNPLYQIGGPRSIQFAMKLIF